MFILAQKYRFAPDVPKSRLTAYAGQSMELKWHLHLMSEPTPQRVHSDLFVENFGIALDLQAGNRDWLDLSGREFDTEDTGGFMLCCDEFSQWGTLIESCIRFGKCSGDRIEIFANGKGSTASFPEHFSTDEVSFEIQTWVRFSGVGLIVPPGSQEPHHEAVARLAAIAPGYKRSTPILREIAHQDKSFGKEFLFPPDSSRSLAWRKRGNS